MDEMQRRTSKKSLGLRAQSWQDAAGVLSCIARQLASYAEPDNTQLGDKWLSHETQHPIFCHGLRPHFDYIRSFLGGFCLSSLRFLTSSIGKADGYTLSSRAWILTLQKIQFVLPSIPWWLSACCLIF